MSILAHHTPTPPTYLTRRSRFSILVYCAVPSQCPSSILLVIMNPCLVSNANVGKLKMMRLEIKERAIINRYFLKKTKAYIRPASANVATGKCKETANAVDVENTSNLFPVYFSSIKNREMIAIVINGGRKEGFHTDLV